MNCVLYVGPAFFDCGGAVELRYYLVRDNGELDAVDEVCRGCEWEGVDGKRECQGLGNTGWHLVGCRRAYLEISKVN